MPQSFHILRCYKCETFQVHIVKKSNKWECKICGDKQSVKQTFGEGTGKECRLHVQKLNELRAQTDDTKILQVEEHVAPQVVSCVMEDKSKWNKYIEDDSKCDKTGELAPSVDNSIEAGDDGSVEYVLELPSKKRKVLKQLSDNRKGKKWKGRGNYCEDDKESESREEINKESILLNNALNSDKWNQHSHKTVEYIETDEPTPSYGHFNENSLKTSHEIHTNQAMAPHSSNKKQTETFYQKASSSKWDQYLEEPDSVDNADSVDETNDSDHFAIDTNHSLDVFIDSPSAVITESTSHFPNDNLSECQMKNNTSHPGVKLNGMFELCDDSNLDEIFNL